MEMNVEQLVKLSESWLPVVLQYSGQLTLAIITLVVGWWLVNALTRQVAAVLVRRNVDRALHSFIGSLAGIVLRTMIANARAEVALAVPSLAAGAALCELLRPLMDKHAQSHALWEEHGERSATTREMQRDVAAMCVERDMVVASLAFSVLPVLGDPWGVAPGRDREEFNTRYAYVLDTVDECSAHGLRLIATHRAVLGESSLASQAAFEKWTQHAAVLRELAPMV